MTYSKPEVSLVAAASAVILSGAKRAGVIDNHHQPHLVTTAAYEADE
ncbi:MAG TPA: hypothetical protein VJR04_12595 [Terriglobales bacterium]|nr:hypothetical protein [Terriglobales bacterium]